MVFLSILPLLAVALSLAMLLKRPYRPSAFSRSMGIALLGFCIFAYFGNSIADNGGGKLFWTCFAILTIYCITIVPFIMHLSSALRMRKKMADKDESYKATPHERG